jgi:hypothetical protein
MDKMLAPEQLRLFWFFAMPGIIVLYVRAQFLAGRLPKVAEGIVAYLIVSVAYHALLFPIARPLYGAEVQGWIGGFVWFAYILVGPAVAGLLLGLNVRRGWLKDLLERFQVHTVHAIEAAWDWRFSDCKDCFVTVVLKDGTHWRGYLGGDSFMSSVPTERDIFIEKVYTIQSDDTWEPRNSGVWISNGEIQSIEFWPNGET